MYNLANACPPGRGLGDGQPNSTWWRYCHCHHHCSCHPVWSFWLDLEWETFYGICNIFLRKKPPEQPHLSTWTCLCDLHAHQAGPCTPPPPGSRVWRTAAFSMEGVIASLTPGFTGTENGTVLLGKLKTAKETGAPGAQGGSLGGTGSRNHDGSTARGVQ